MYNVTHYQDLFEKEIEQNYKNSIVRDLTSLVPFLQRMYNLDKTMGQSDGGVR